MSASNIWVETYFLSIQMLRRVLYVEEQTIHSGKAERVDEWGSPAVRVSSKELDRRLARKDVCAESRVSVYLQTGWPLVQVDDKGAAQGMHESNR